MVLLDGAMSLWFVLAAASVLFVAIGIHTTLAEIALERLSAETTSGGKRPCAGV